MADVKPLAVPSVYAGIGDWFAHLACFASFSLCLVWTFVLSASAGPLLWRVVRAYRA